MVEASEILVTLPNCSFQIDRREPDVIRLAPKPLYNTFSDVHRFITMLEQAFQAILTNGDKANDHPQK